MYWNIKTILERIPGWDTNNSSSSSPLMVIRSEHNNKDFLTINKILGDPNPVDLDAAGAKNGRVQSLLQVTKNISSIGRRRLCWALLPEYKVYVEALSRSINLSDQDKLVSLRFSQRMCPDLTWLLNKNIPLRH